MRRKCPQFCLLLLSLLGLVIASCGKRKVPDPATQEESKIPVVVAPASVGSIDDTVLITGTLVSDRSSVIAAKVGGRVQSLHFREGDFVRGGAVIAQLVPSDAAAQLESSEAGLNSARARESLAETTLQWTQVDAALQEARAEALVQQAREQLAIVKKGAREQERARAASQLAAAKTGYEVAQQTLARYEKLLKDGAIPQLQVDNARTARDSARMQYELARETLDLINEGPRVEEVRAAEAGLRAAEEGLRIARNNKRSFEMRQADLQTSHAAAAQAAAGLRLSQQQLADLQIRAPFAGHIAKRFTEVGEIVGPGAPVVQLVSLRNIELDADVSEKDIARIRVGQKTFVTVDSLPDSRFSGTVARVIPSANTKNRNFTVKVKVNNGPMRLMDGMFARASVLIDRRDGVVLVPKDALVQVGEEFIVYVVKNQMARVVPVKVGVASDSVVEVKSGLAGSEYVVISGQGSLKDGQPVKLSK